MVMKEGLEPIDRKIKRAFNTACTTYGLLEDGDRILIGLSGGKDSLMLVKMLGERSLIFRPSLSVCAVHVVMDNVPYVSDVDYMSAFCARYHVSFHVLHTGFTDEEEKGKTKCALCSWKRRKLLFRYAQDEGYNKVALGHHQNDFLVTMLMNLSFEGAFAAMSPLTGLDRFGLKLIRPLCLVREEDIRHYAELDGWKKVSRSCPYEDCSQRANVTRIAEELLALNPEVRYNMWHALHNVQFDRLPQKVK